MSSQTEPIHIQALVNANASKAWEYYTSPEHITQWNFADPSWCCPTAENDLRIGGTYKARMEAVDGSMGFDFIAVYKELDPGKRFTYVMEDGRNARVEFIPEDEQTRVTVTFDPEGENPIEMQRAGWQAILNNYKSYTESN
ncbi:activator of HSP90 ATPase [bacterium]|nr:activator of HSP90 ATPase [bacterium]